MATAISKPAASQPPKMKRPPPSFTQSNSVVNGIKQSPSTTSSPALASKRLPGANQQTANGIATPMGNGALNRPVNRPRKDNQKPGDISTSRPQRATTRASVAEADRRVTKIPPEPFVKTSQYILKKYSKSPPSLILHLHPTHFRFDQQDGSFPYNSEMKVIIEHIRSQTIPHDMLEELLRANVKFYEGCLIVKVVDHKSVSAKTNKTTATSTDEKNTPFSIHNYNQHVTPSPYVPYPKQNQIKSEVNDLSKSDIPEKKHDPDSADSTTNNKPATENGTAGTTNESGKQPEHIPRVFTTVLHPTPLSLQAELTYLSTTPHPHANANSAATKKQPTTAQPQNKSSGQPPTKRQKMLVDPEDLPKFEATLIRAVAPPVYLDPVDSFESAQELLRLMESPLHCARPPSPKRRKRTVAELAADEALAAEEERFMLIMDERLEPATSGAAAGAKIAVDDTAGAVPFEPRFSRFKTIENIRMQHEEKAKREHEKKLQQEQAKRQQQQEQERERRRLLEQRQEELAKEERRQQLAAQHAQAQLAAQQQQRLAQVSQGQMSSPVVRNQTPHATSSPVVGSGIVTQGGVPMSMTASTPRAGSPPRPPSTMQHAHPAMMGHPMAPSRSQQSHSRNGTPQMTQGTPAMSHATPIMRNVTPNQRMPHGSPPTTTLTQTPVMGNAMMGTPQMGAGMGLTPQQQQQLMLQQRQHQQMLAQQGLTPQQYAQLQAQQNIQNHHQQQVLNQQQQVQQNQMPQHQMPQQYYQAQLIRNQMQQMQMAQQKQNHQQQGGMQMTPQQQQQQQQQMFMAAAQANANQGQVPQTAQNARYQQMFKQRLQASRQEMQKRFQSQYGSPQQYPPPIAQQYFSGLENAARAWIQEVMRRENLQAQQRQQAAIIQQQQMMANGMGK
ncbi:conserved hypothetical protein [Talaromyces stipitatus ATCC 10500]|uniref:Spt20-like SEP domain-containing protein n=1 Tax=Talaromyces stipitatus (strain ATCC 10500 / CBS 375.48 / QM 6759 / NRRL 1006) TaxID=441959 RepID=B8M3F6_TALSN|nr:uncharacterized protein TSTA_095770 [Talaromyces stipitatus ATCC 10500]EED22328.1 conserved hypothetical protein [Talaromyces stipitatus ATCC 10500]